MYYFNNEFAYEHHQKKNNMSKLVEIVLIAKELIHYHIL